MAGSIAPPQPRAAAPPHRTLTAPKPRPDAPPPVRTPMTPAAALRATVAALVVGALLCGHSLVDIAERQPFGHVRDVTVPAAKAIARVGAFFSLDRPRQWVDDALGREDTGGTAGAGFAFDQPGPAAGPTAPPTTVAPTTTTTVALRAVTVAAPLRVYVAGDSAAQPLGETLKSAGGTSGLLNVELQFELGTGFARPEVYNWPNRLVEVASTAAPEAVVFFAGGNDYQDLSAPTQPYTRVAARDTPEWYDEYRRRIAGTMDLLAAPGRTVFWVGQPVMRDGEMDQALQLVNAIAADEASRRPWVTFIDSRPLFVDGAGGFTAFLTMPDGQVVECRNADGVHLTRPCSDLLADKVLAAISATWHVAVQR